MEREDADPDADGDDLLLTFYGDDFTGSTDVLESLELSGVRTVLFLETPSPDDLAEFEGVEAVGRAGTSRTMTPDEMDGHLPEEFGALREFDAAFCHYKVCSTFDSSPEVGSIGRALDIGREIFDGGVVPIVVAAPSLEPRGRYVVFGNLFATVDDTTHRLDRHPTMSEHPVTPMGEADLRCHLGDQTDAEIDLLEVRHLDAGDDQAAAALDETVARDPAAVLFDGLSHDHQRRVGRLVWEQLGGGSQTFAVGSSGFEYALTAHLREAGALAPDAGARYDPSPVDRILVVSGSASPVNADQIEWALDNGFEGIRLRTERLVDGETAIEERERAIGAARSALEAGRSPLVYSARGPDDPAIERTEERADRLGVDPGEVGRRLGDEQGRITKAVLAESDVERLCVAGGDTSGHVAGHLDVYALEFAATVGPGSPLCRASSETDRFDGIDLALKGGQVQTRHEADDYFGVVLDGGVP